MGKFPHHSGMQQLQHGLGLTARAGLPPAERCRAVYKCGLVVRKGGFTELGKENEDEAKTFFKPAQAALASLPSPLHKASPLGFFFDENP